MNRSSASLMYEGVYYPSQYALYWIEMNSKERMLHVLSGERLSMPPVVLHSWGDYKIELAGIHPKYQYFLGGPELARIETNFYQRFRPDWIHLGSGSSRHWWSRSRQVRESRAFIRSFNSLRWIEIRDNYWLAERDDGPLTNDQPRLRLESIREIDEFYDAIYCSESEILASGCFDHIKELSAAYGEEVLIVINDGAPGCGLYDHGFEEALIACAEKPDLVAYAIYRDCESFLERVGAAKSAGAHAYIFSEGFGGSTDLLSPDLHRIIELETKRWFYSEVKKRGMLGIGYWLGDVRPVMDLINGMDMAALMIEEDKKAFQLDPVVIRRQLRQETCLIGNIDSALLLRGTPEEIREAVNRQKTAASYGPFVIANGSPLILGTPPGNIDILMEEARRDANG